MLTVNEQIGSKIRLLRKEAGLKQEDFGKLFGMSQNRVTNIETGKSALSFEELLAFADYFKVPTDYILKENGVREDNPSLQYICNYTGLNGNTIEILNRMSKLKEPTGIRVSANGKKRVFDKSDWSFHIKLFEEIIIKAPIFNAFTDLKEALYEYQRYEKNKDTNIDFEESYYRDGIDFQLYKIQKEIIDIVEKYGSELVEKEFFNVMEAEYQSTYGDWEEMNCDE